MNETSRTIRHVMEGLECDLAILRAEYERACQSNHSYKQVSISAKIANLERDLSTLKNLKEKLGL